MKIIDFKTTAYFSGAIFFGILLLPIGFLLILLNVFFGLFVLLIGILAITTHYRVAIDVKNKLYRDYLWILGARTGSWEHFETIEYLFIKTNNVKQTMNARTISSTIQKQVFDAYLKFSERQKIHLATCNTKQQLLDKIRPIAKSLDTQIVDYTAP